MEIGAGWSARDKGVPPAILKILAVFGNPVMCTITGSERTGKKPPYPSLLDQNDHSDPDGGKYLLEYSTIRSVFV